MNRTTKEVFTDYPMGWHGKVEISKIKKDIAEIEKSGATHIYFDYDSGHMDYPQNRPFYERLETDKEFKERMAPIEEAAKRKKEQELKTLAELKSKYESKPQR